MKTENKIITLFIENKTPKTIREIAKQIHSDYQITHTAAKRLISKNIIVAQTVGKSLLCTLNDMYYGNEIYHAENKRKEHLLKNKNLGQLHKEIMVKVDTSFFVLLLFGSYAKGMQTKSSDIDLLFISNQKGMEETVTSILSLLPLKIQALVFTEKEFIRMKDAKKQNVVQEAIKNNVPLYGIEQYYRIKNA